MLIRRPTDSARDPEFYGARGDSGGEARFQVVGTTTLSDDISSVLDNGSETALVQGVSVPSDGQVDFLMMGDGGPAEASLNALVMRSQPVGERFCHSTSNSTGYPAVLDAAGSASLTHDNLQLTVRNVPVDLGLFFHAAEKTQVPFGNGLLCASGSIYRFPPTFAADGSASLQISLDAAGITSAGSRYFQYWYRDPTAAGATYNTSDGVEVQFVP